MGENIALFYLDWTGDLARVVVIILRCGSECFAGNVIELEVVKFDVRRMSCANERHRGQEHGGKFACIYAYVHGIKIINCNLRASRITESIID